MPASGWNSKTVTTGPGCMPVTVALDLEFGQFLSNLLLDDLQDGQVDLGVLARWVEEAAGRQAFSLGDGGSWRVRRQGREWPGRRGFRQRQGAAERSRVRSDP